MEGQEQHEHNKQCDSEESNHHHVLQISIAEASSVRLIKKTCGEASCGFSDAKTNSRDAAERAASIRKLLVAVVLCGLFITVEVVGGIKANSLAILTDAAHLLSDVAAFAISLFSLWVSAWEPTPRHSYGFFRIEILGALVSIQIIWLLAGVLVYEAIARLHNGCGEVQGSLMFLVSAVGLLVNIAMAVLLGHDHGCHSHDHSHHHEHEHDHHHDDPHLSEALLDNGTGGGKSEKKQRNLNIQGAYLHVMGDLIQSIG
ncbi:hypothetical protein CARUB_v100028010mg, partial [Capsella rubella]